MIIVILLLAAAAAAYTAARAIREQVAREKSPQITTAEANAKFHIGTDIASGEAIVLTEEQLQEHVLLIGATGSGKSRAAGNLIRGHIDQGRGIIAVDPHGDTADDAFAYVVRRALEGDDEILKRTIYIEFSPQYAVGIDPLRMSFPGVHPDFVENCRKAALTTVIDQVAEIIQRRMGTTSFQETPRLLRVMRYTLRAVGTEIGGKRLSLADTVVVLNPFHRLHRHIVDKLRPALPASALADLDFLHALAQAGRINDIRTEIESTLNRIAGVLTELTREVFTANSSINWTTVIDRQQFVFVNLRPSRYLSRDQSFFLGGMIIRSVVDAMQAQPRSQRKPFTVLVEEAGELLADDLQRDLGAVRKYKVRFVLCAQDLSSWRKPNLDMTPKAISQPGTVISFQQKWPEDANVLAQVQFSGNFNLARYRQEVDRHRGYVWQKVYDVAFSMSRQEGWNLGSTTNQSSTIGEQHSTTEQHQINWNQVIAKGTALSSQHSRGNSEGTVATTGTSVVPVVENGHLVRSFELDAPSAGKNTSTQENRSDGTTVTDTTSRGSGGAIVQGGTHGVSGSTTKGAGDSAGLSGGSGQTVTISQKTTPLANIVPEIVETPQFMTALDDQMTLFAAQIVTLLRRHCVIRTNDHPAGRVVYTADCPDPFVTPEAQEEAIAYGKRHMLEVHDFVFIPDFGEEKHERRLQEFLEADASTADGSAASSEPVNNPYGN